MDWSKIKTIFIIAFFVLDIYLIYEYTDIKKSQSTTNREEEPVENTLAYWGITYDASKFPKELKKGHYISAKSKTFSYDEVKQLEKEILKGQTVSISESNILKSELEKPLALKGTFKPEDLTAFIQKHIWHGDQYRFWEKTGNTITFYQIYDGKILYQNVNGKLTFHLNEQNKVVSYQQTFLEGFKEVEKQETLTRPVDAIYLLFKNTYIKSEAEIKNVEMGYYSQQFSSTQLLSPTWRVIVNSGENLFIKAFESDSQIYSSINEESKLE
ncbi:two-component system regulatory protein YycI [Niallia sp. 03133]|uniref:two-component system regulatory protein YycI n=1 Tax=Niallia sp. 03133 TaxID=3458060 RepID=UPI004043DC4A